MNELNLFDAISLCDYNKNLKNSFFNFLQTYILYHDDNKSEFYLYKKKYILCRYFLKVNYENKTIPIKLLLYFIKHFNEEGIELYLENFDNFMINNYYKGKIIDDKTLKIKYKKFINFKDYEGNLIKFLNDLMIYLKNNFSNKFPLFRANDNNIYDYGKKSVLNKNNLIKINIIENNNNNNYNNNNNNNNYNNNNNNYKNYQFYDYNNFKNNKNLSAKTSKLLGKMNLNINDDDQAFLNNIDDNLKVSYLIFDPSEKKLKNNNNLQNNNKKNIELEQKRKKEEIETYNFIQEQTFNKIIDELTSKILYLDETKTMLLNEYKEKNKQFYNLLENLDEIKNKENSLKNEMNNKLIYKNLNLNNINSYLRYSNNVYILINYNTKIKTIENYLYSLKKLILNNKIPFKNLIKEYRLNSRLIFYLHYKYYSLYNSNMKKNN